MVELVRQRPREMDAHPAEGALADRQVEGRLRDGRGIERRCLIADPEPDRVGHLEERDLDRAWCSGVAVADDIADELVDGLDEVARRLGIAAGGRDPLADEGPNTGELVDTGRDRDRREGVRVAHWQVGHGRC